MARQTSSVHRAHACGRCVLTHQRERIAQQNEPGRRIRQLLRKLAHVGIDLVICLLDLLRLGIYHVCCPNQDHLSRRQPAGSIYIWLPARFWRARFPSETSAAGPSSLPRRCRASTLTGHVSCGPIWADSRDYHLDSEIGAVYRAQKRCSSDDAGWHSSG